MDPRAQIDQIKREIRKKDEVTICQAPGCTNPTKLKRMYCSRQCAGPESGKKRKEFNKSIRGQTVFYLLLQIKLRTAREEIKKNGFESQSKLK